MEATSCRGCWWKEGDRCYLGDPPRNPDGTSTILAEERCDQFKSKREALTKFIPSDMLTIVSELNDSINKKK